MVFAIVIFLMVGIIAFFHYVQGFFSATISAMCAILAAVLAVSYDETVVNLLLRGKMADYAHGMVLCMLFIVGYFVLRTIFDAAIPGNVRTPNVVDKIGAGLMGIAAGIFASGIFAIAVQMLPFDPLMSFMGYSRQAMIDEKKVVIHPGGGRQALDAVVGPAMVDTSLDPAKEKGLLLPVDDMVLAMVNHLSDGGSLSGDRTFSSIHPDYLEELYGERLGIQTGARRVALALSGNDPVEVPAVFSTPSMPVADNETTPDIRAADFKSPYKSPLKPGPGQELIIVRVKVNSSASDDEDGIFRFSTGSIHLVGPSKDGTFKDYYPIGTVENGNTILTDNPDDFLFVKTGDEFDAAFLVDDSLLKGSGKNSNAFVDGVFISVKRFGLVDLANMDVKSPYVGDPGVKMIRQKYTLETLKLPPPNYSAAPSAPSNSSPSPARGTRDRASTPQAAPAAPSDSAAAVPQPTPGKEISSEDLVAKVSDGILVTGSVQIGTDAPGQDAKDAAVAGGKISLVGGTIASATIDPTETISKLEEGASTYNQFLGQQGKKLVQVQVQPYSNKWEDWMSDYAKTKLIDANGNPYDANGAYALAREGNGPRKLFMRYDCNTVVSMTPPDVPMSGSLYLMFLVPSGTDIKSLKMGDKTQDLHAVVHVP